MGHPAETIIQASSNCPAHAVQVLTNCYYKDVPGLAMDLAAVLRRQIEFIEAGLWCSWMRPVLFVSQDAPWAAEAIKSCAGTHLE